MIFCKFNILEDTVHGIVISVKEELGIPVKFIGVGEKMDDLQPFDRHAFVSALFETGEEASS